MTTTLKQDLNHKITPNSTLVFGRFIETDNIIKENGIKSEKEDGYVRVYYPNSELLEEISSSGIKVKMKFYPNKFSRIKNQKRTESDIFLKYNGELFGIKSYSIKELASNYGLSFEQVRKSIYEIEREVFEIIEIKQ